MKMYVVGMLALAGVAFWTAFAYPQEGSKYPPLVPGKVYVTATISDGKGRTYTQLAYRPAGEFDTKEACLAWKPDEDFVKATVQLIQSAEKNFGPDTKVSMACLPAPEPGDKV